MIYTLSKPFTFEGKEYTEIEFDLDSLKGADIKAAKRKFNKDGNFAAIPAADAEFCTILLQKLTKLPFEFFDEMPAGDFCTLTQTVTNFLLS